ncbi:MAG: hypothetical protein ACYC6Y_09790 [Thermoguttaceae bacterium]
MDDQSNHRGWQKFSQAVEAELPQYRALSGLAVLGFILGLASALAVVHIGLSFVGAFAAICCVAALVSISRAPSERSGGWLAVTGLALAAFWMAAGSTRELTERYLLDVYSRPFALQWFEYLKKGEPAKALEMANGALARRPLDDKLLKHYLSSQEEYESLQSFVGKPEVRALLALGERAQVRHYGCVEAHDNSAAQVFAVTYEEQQTKKSFLVQINVTRTEVPEQGVAAWRTEDSTGPWNPSESSRGPGG